MLIKLRSRLSKVLSSMQRNGLSGTVRRLHNLRYKLWANDEFDAIHGTATRQCEQLAGLTIESPNAKFGILYVPTGQMELARALHFIRGPFHDYAFIDLGCGKGRTMIVAARFGFGSIIGVEFAEELVTIARKNLAIAALGNSSIVHCDAGDYQFPNSNLVIYMYNPFKESVMRRVLDNLQSASTIGPHRQVYVVYKNPKHADIFDNATFLTRMKTPRWTFMPDFMIWKSCFQPDAAGRHRGANGRGSAGNAHSASANRGLA